MKGKIYISKNDEVKLINRNDLDYYLSLGYIKKHNHQNGRPNMKNNTITKGRIWVTNGKVNKMIYENQLEQYKDFHRGITKLK